MEGRCSTQLSYSLPRYQIFQARKLWRNLRGGLRSHLRQESHWWLLLEYVLTIYLHLLTRGKWRDKDVRLVNKTGWTIVRQNASIHRAAVSTARFVHYPPWLAGCRPCSLLVFWRDVCNATKVSSWALVIVYTPPLNSCKSTRVSLREHYGVRRRHAGAATSGSFVSLQWPLAKPRRWL